MTNSVDASGSQPKEQLKQQSKKAPEEAKAAEEAKAKEAESLEASSGSTKPKTAPESTNESRAQAAAKREQNTSGSGQNKETLLTQIVSGYKPEAEPQTQARALLTHLKKQTSEDTTNDVFSDYNEGSSSESTQPANPDLQLVQTKQSYIQESTQALQAVRQLSNEQKQKIIDLSEALIRLGKPEEVTQALKDLFLQPQKAQEILSNLEETTNQADIEAFEVQAQNLRLNVTEEIKKLARESRDIIQARNILLQANSQTKYPSQEEKDLYLKATEAMLSGQEQLTDIILGNLMLGNIEEAQRAYQENLESLSPEQRLAKMQTLHTAKITENARTVETALEHEQEQFKKRMTSVRDTFQHMDNCLGQRSNQQHEIGFDPFRPSLMNNNSTGKRGLQDLLKAAQESTEDKPLDVYEFVNQSFRSADLKLQIETPSLSSALSQRAELKDIQLEATQLAQAGNIEMAAALLNGDISITDIETAKLQQSNPYAARLTAPDGSEVSDEDMITLEREQLEKLINQNRMAMAQLENQRNSLFSRLEENPLGEDKPAQLEHHALLSAQQKQLERQTQRLFQTHDRVTKLVNEGNYAGARDILEGRTSVLAERQEAENLQSAAQLADRHFTRTAAEEEKYQETQKVLKALQQEQEDQSHLENGTRRNLSQTYKDLRENSGWVARWGGLTEQLQKQRDLERGRLDQFERQREQVDRLKDTARSLIAQGKYDEATDLLAKTIDFSSESFQNANSAMIKSYQAINEEIEEFDQKFKDEALTVIKHVAIGTVAVGVTLALAPATGGLSLAAAGTMIGGGTLAGAGVGLFIDVVDDAVVDTKVFGDTLAEGFGYNEEDGYWGIAKEFGGKQYRNVQSAFTASLTFTGATSLSRPLIARGFSAYKSTGLSTLFTAPATSSVNLGFDKIAAEAEYLDMSEEQRAAYSSKAKFLESRGLSPASMFKRVTFDTGTEVLASLVGVKIDRFFSKIKGVQGQAREQAAAQLKKELLIDFTRNGVEDASDIAFGLIAEYMTNPEGITSQGLAQNIVQALVGRKIGDFTAQSFESRRLMPDLSGESNSLPENSASARKNTPITEPVIDSEQNVKAKTVLEVDRNTLKRVATISYDSEASQNNPRTSTEENLHARENIINPGTINPDTGKAPMDLAEYQARRALREAVAQQAADAKVASKAGESVSEAKTSHSQKIKDINAAITAGKFDDAIKLAKEAQYIDDQYLGQYKADYDHNTNPDNSTLRQTSFSAVDDYTELTDIANRSDIEDLRTSIEEDTTLTEQQRADLQETINQREQRIILDEQNQKISDLLKEKGLDSDPGLAALANDPTTPDQVELRRILLDESVTGNDAILRNSLLDSNEKIRALAHDAIGFDAENRAAATMLLGSDPAKAIQVADLRSVINHKPGAPLNFNASARIHTQLSKLGIITDSINNILKNKEVQSIIGENYPNQSDLRDIQSKVARRNPKWKDSIGAVHEMRAHIALERMVANGDIRSFVMAENVVNKYPETGRYERKKSIGLDALGIDVLIVKNNGDIVPSQIKSSDTGVRENFIKEVPYIDSAKNQIKIQRRWNNPFDATGLSLTQMQNALNNPSPGNSVVRITDPNSLPSGVETSQVVIDGATFGELNVQTGAEISTIRNTAQMSILEAAIIRSQRPDPNAR